MSEVLGRIEAGLDDSHRMAQRFDDVLDKLEKDAHKVNKLEKAIHGLSGAWKAMTGIASGVFVFDAIGDSVGSAIDKLKEFGAAALQEAGKIERLTATFAALEAPAQLKAIENGMTDAATPLESGKFIMDFIEKLAPNALGQFDDLAEGATKLEASGLLVERWLPMVADLAGAFGGTQEKIIGVSEALAKLASGSSGEALERLRDFAITRTALEVEGIEFDGGGSLKSSIEDTLLAVETIAKEKFGNIGEFMNGTFEQRFSNLGDAWNALMHDFGDGLLPLAGKLLETGQSFISYLSDSEWISNLADNVSNAFEHIMGGTGVPDFVWTLTALIERFPDAMIAAWEGAQKVGEVIEKIIVGTYNFFGEIGTGLVNLFQNGLVEVEDRFNQMLARVITSLANLDWKGILLGTQNAVDGALDMAGKLLMSEEHKPDRVFEPIKDSSEIFGRIFGDTAMDNFWKDTQKRADELQKGYEAFTQKGKPGIGDTSGLDMFNGSYIQSGTDDLLEKIAKHTGETADHTKKQIDINKFLFGGGDVGRNGVSMLEVSRVPSEGAAMRQGKLEVSVGKSRDTLERAMQEIVLELVGQLARSGYIAGGVR